MPDRLDDSGPAPVDHGPEAVTAWLTERFGTVDDVTPIGAGAWSRAYGFTSAGRELVARFGAHLDDFTSDAHAGVFDAPALPVPQTVLVAPALGGFVSVTTRCRGRFLEDLDTPEWRRMLPGLLAGLRHLWSIDAATLAPDAAAQFGAGRSWSAFLRSVDTEPADGRGSGWKARLAGGPLGDGSFRTGLAVLDRLCDSAAVRAVDAAPRLVHSDLVNRNVLVEVPAAGAARLTGVFDWGCCFVGDPLYDLAWLEFWSPWHSGLGSLDIRAESADLVAEAGIDPAQVDDRWRACCLHIGLGHLAYFADVGDTGNLLGTGRRLATCL